MKMPERNSGIVLQVSYTLKTITFETLISRWVLRLCFLGLQGVDEVQEFSLKNAGFRSRSNPIPTDRIALLL
jgi:hypothetical protein